MVNFLFCTEFKYYADAEMCLKYRQTNLKEMVLKTLKLTLVISLLRRQRQGESCKYEASQD